MHYGDSKVRRLSPEGIGAHPMPKPFCRAKVGGRRTPVEHGPTSGAWGVFQNLPCCMLGCCCWNDGSQALE